MRQQIIKDANRGKITITLDNHLSLFDFRKYFLRRMKFSDALHSVVMLTVAFWATCLFFFVANGQINSFPELRQSMLNGWLLLGCVAFAALAVLLYEALTQLSEGAFSLEQWQYEHGERDYPPDLVGMSEARKARNDAGMRP
jgi:hypothetical protein